MSSSWKPLEHQPTFNASTMLLLTDGTVICHDDAGNRWFKLTPSRTGTYAEGTWQEIDHMRLTRKFFASQVLKDGRVLVVGGEYSDDPNVPKGQYTPTAEVYDPDANEWSNVRHAFDWIRGDASSCMLADGRILYGAVSEARTAIYDPSTGKWVEAGTAHGTTASSKWLPSDEESWVLLSDNTVLTVNISESHAEKYLPGEDRWVPAGSPKTALVEFSEIGPAVLLPDGRAWFVGASGHTAFYKPPAKPSDPGTWSKGPDFDLKGQLLSIIDGPACVRPNGKVLAVAGITHLELTGKPNPKFLPWSGPCTFFELDPKTNELTPLAADDQPPTAPRDTWAMRLLLLPSGEVLFSNALPQLFLFDPKNDRKFDPEWAPRIVDFDTKRVCAGETHVVHGTQLTGLSQAVGYGDDYTAATNYPLARLVFDHTGTTVFCKTFDFSTMGVATGSKVENFKFRVPEHIGETGPASLLVSVNGIPAHPIKVAVCSDFFRVAFTDLRCIETTDDQGSPSDEPYAVFFTLDLQGLVPTFQASRTRVFGGVDESPADRVQREHVRIWGVSGKSEVITHPDKVIILVALMENDDSNPDQVLSVAAAQTATLALGLGLAHTPRSELLQKLRKAFKAGLLLGASVPNVFDSDDDMIASVQELRIQQSDLDEANRTGKATRVVKFRDQDDAGKYDVHFEIAGGFATKSG